MTNFEFQKIIDDVISSYLMENIIIPESVIDEVKKIYVTENYTNEKVLVKSKGDGFDDNRGKQY